MTLSRHIGKYEILEELGRGGFATVYKARDTKLDRVVALKVLHPYWREDPGFAERFQREAHAAANLRHPSIVTIHEADEADGQLYIAMEYLPGRSLKELLSAEGALTLQRALPILEQIAHALDYAHEQGVVHRDIKPANVMVEDTPRGKRATLLDFGLVKALETSTALTSHGTLLGSPEYMAPEQADPNRASEIGPATDRYAFGIVAYQMLTGRVPFPGNAPATLNAHLHLAPPDPRTIRRGLPVSLVEALAKMLAKPPKDRFDSARVFVTRLRGGALPEGSVRPRETRRPLPLWARGLAGLAALVMLTGILTARLATFAPPPSTPTVSTTLTSAPPAPTKVPTTTSTPTPTATNIPAPTITNTPTPTAVPTLGLGSTRTRATDGMVMVHVPGGTFQMGSNDVNSDEKPVHEVTLDSFWIDQTEVTNAQYTRCDEADRCNAPSSPTSYTRDSYYGNSEFADYPVIFVSWEDAKTYCEWAGGRLPTEAEWEYAARGPQGLVYPWGNEFDGRKLNFCDKNCAIGWVDKNVDDGYADTAPVGSYPDGASWASARDMAGNVWEWVADWYGAYPSESQVNPTGPRNGVFRVLRGGSFYSVVSHVRAANRDNNTPGNRVDYGVGFRCVGAAPGE